MARPTFVVQYLVFCESVEYLDRRRPYRDSVLNRVDYVLSVPADTEFPYEPPEFWLFARIYSLSDAAGDTRPLSVSCVWRDAPAGGEREVWRRTLGPVRFLHPHQVMDRAWAFRNREGDVPYRFPGPGRYEFRLWFPRRGWPRQRVAAREHMRVEVEL